MKAFDSRLEQKMLQGKNVFERDKRVFLLCFISVLGWGMAAHAYVFFQSAFSHDSLMLFMDYGWRIALGRIFVPVYHEVLRGMITLPWMIGALSMLFMGMAVFLVVKAFGIRSVWVTVLTAGIFCANITIVSSAATYIHDLDAYMLALLLAVSAFFLWKKKNLGFVAGILPLAVSMGLYQSYTCVTITLVMFSLIADLLERERFVPVLIKGLKSVAMIIDAGLVYLVAVKLSCMISGVELYTGGYNSLSTVLSMSPRQIIKTAVYGYFETLRIMLLPKSVYADGFEFAVQAVLMIMTGLIIFVRLFSKHVAVKEKILALLLIGLLPLGMNFTYVLTDGMSNDRVHFAIWLFHLFTLLVVWRYLKPGNIRVIARVVTCVLMAVILLGNVRMANTVYLKKDLEHKANVSLFTRVLYRMEDYDGYVTGQTPVAIVGRPDAVLSGMDGFEKASQITGAGNAYILGAADRGYYVNFFEYVMLNPISLADAGTWQAMQENVEVAQMPCYPQDGCIQMIDGTLVVKLGQQ